MKFNHFDYFKVTLSKEIIRKNNEKYISRKINFISSRNIVIWFIYWLVKPWLFYLSWNLNFLKLLILLFKLLFLLHQLFHSFFKFLALLRQLSYFSDFPWVYFITQSSLSILIDRIEGIRRTHPWRYIINRIFTVASLSRTGNLLLAMTTASMYRTADWQLGSCVTIGVHQLWRLFSDSLNSILTFDEVLTLNQMIHVRWSTWGLFLLR